MMFQAGIPTLIKQWTAPEFYDGTLVEDMWRSWAEYEAVKRFVTLSVYGYFFLTAFD
jgi:hypothetical protein